MTETEQLLLNTLQDLENNRQKTETELLDALESLAMRVQTLEQENQHLNAQQQQLAESLNRFVSTLAKFKNG